MKVGSIVVVKKLPSKLDSRIKDSVKWLPIDDQNTPYVLRDGELEYGQMIWRFEEGVIGYNPFTKIEWGISSDLLIEILPPEEQVNVQELVQELVTIN